MKQNFLRVLVPFFALCLLAGCGTEKPGTTPESAPADWPLRISAILPHDDQGYWTTLGAGILERAGELEADAKIVTPQLNYNISQMIELIRQATAAQVDAIIVQGIEDPDYLRALEDASDAGVQVVMVDTNVAETFPHLYVGTDNYAAGVQRAGADPRDRRQSGGGGAHGRRGIPQPGRAGAGPAGRDKRAARH